VLDGEGDRRLAEERQRSVQCLGDKLRDEPADEL
jgi:hypothetical protein